MASFFQADLELGGESGRHVSCCECCGYGGPSYTKAPPPMVAPNYDRTGSISVATAAGAGSIAVWISSPLWAPSRAAAVIAQTALPVGKLTIAGSRTSLCSAWKHKEIGPTVRTRA